MIFELISKDQLEIQKYKLKRDAELLNKVIVIDDQGKVFARKEYLHLINKKNKRRKKYNQGLAFGTAWDSSSSCSSEVDEFGSSLYNHGSINVPYLDGLEHSDVYSPRVGDKLTPKKGKLKSSIGDVEESKTLGDMSDNSVDKEDDSIPEEHVLHHNSEDKKGLHELDSSNGALSYFNNLAPLNNQILTDEA